MRPVALEFNATRAHSRRVETGLQSDLLHQLVCIAAITLLAAPAVTPAAALVRWTFPAMTALVAGFLYFRGRSGPYFAFCLWLFLLTPFVRRVVDLQAGFAKANVLMLAPYLALGWSSLHAIRFFTNPRSPIQVPMFGVFAAIFYGFVLAIGDGRLLAGLIDLLRWSAPPLFACYLMVSTHAWGTITRELKAVALVGLPLISLYGVYQYVAPPLWDIKWMLESGVGAIGYPLPFMVRVFGPLNSPASLAFYLVALSLICIAARNPLRWVGIAAGAIALALTVFRTAWLTCALSLALLLVLGASRVRTSLIVIVGGAILLAPLMLTNARVQQTIVSRFDTLSAIGSDKSYNERVIKYQALGDELSAHPFGMGLGISNTASNFGGNSRAIDGGPIDILLSFGIVGGGLYGGMIAIIVLMVIIQKRAALDPDLDAALRAIAVTQAIGLLSTSTVVGEMGMLFWLSTGLALGAPSKAALAEATDAQVMPKSAPIRAPALQLSHAWPSRRYTHATEIRSTAAR